MKASLNTRRGRIHEGHVSSHQPMIKEWEMKAVASLSAHFHGAELQLALEGLSRAFCSLVFKVKGLQ